MPFVNIISGVSRLISLCLETSHSALRKGYRNLVRS